MHTTFGQYIREKREALLAQNARYSLRQVAARVGVQPSYISKVERGEQAPPSEATIMAIARDLNEDSDVLLALAGKVSRDLLEIILKRPQLFARLIRELKDIPDQVVFRIAQKARMKHRKGAEQK